MLLFVIGAVVPSQVPFRNFGAAPPTSETYSSLDGYREANEVAAIAVV